MAENKPVDSIYNNSGVELKSTDNNPITTTSVLRNQEGYSKLNSDISDISSLLRKLFRSNGLYEDKDMKYVNGFYRFPRNDPYNMVKSTKEYVFFTKPDLNILGEKGVFPNGGESNIAYFNDLKNLGYNKTILADLTQTSQANLDNCPFIRILSNRKTSNLDIQDITTEHIESPQNLYGTNILYPKSSMRVDEDAEFTMEFEDTKYLEVYQLFKAWDIYRQANYLGLISPKKEYITHKIMSECISVYKFIVAEDGETLLYWCRYTGVFPNSISRSSFSEIPEGGPLKINIGFKLSGFFEDMEPMILSEFNQIVKRWISGKGYELDVNIWNEEIQAINGETMDFAYISEASTWNGEATDFNTYKQYSLKWGLFVRS